nr:ribonuclease H-like domain-containing protein [Tanacetum cinerariifolium]
MPSMKEELDQSTTPPLCKTGCGFYVNKETGGFCSSCFKVDVLKNKASSEVPKIRGVNNNVDNQEPVENQDQSNEVVKKRNRCHVCNKHVGLVPFLCRCGESFCGLLRMPEKHVCKFDFKAAGRVVLEKHKPLCVADKLEFRANVLKCTYDNLCGVNDRVNKVFVIMSLHGYSNGDKYNNGSDVDNVTLISKLDVSHPLHFHPNDFMALTVFSVKLKGTENYQVWSCAMLLALEVFVIMSLHGYSNGDEYDNESDVNNVTLISKLDVSHPLPLHPNDFVALTVFSVKLKGTENYQVWSCAMLLALEGKNKTGFIDGSCRRCTCHAADDFKKHNKLMKLLQFIMGLNDTYMKIISSILSRETLFDVRSAYAIISNQVLNVLRPNLLFENDKSDLMCETCQRAKQTREPFPLSDHVSTELGLNNKDFFNLDGSIDHSEIPYDDKRSDPALVDTAASENDRSANPKDNDNNISEECFEEASKHQPWIDAMNSKMDAIYRNNTWDLVKLPKGRKAIGSKWVWKIKYKSDGEIEIYNVRLVAKGFNQKERIVFDETFSPMVKFVTIRCLINLVVQNSWTLYQMDVNNAFLYGDLNETVYMSLPPSYFPKDETRVCKLNKSLYRLKQTLRKWNSKLTSSLIEYDIIIIGINLNEINKFKQFLKTKFMIKDLGKLKYYLGIEVLETPTDVCFSQRKHCLELIDEFGLLASKPSYIPMQPNISLSSKPKDDDPLLDNITDYQKLIGKCVNVIRTSTSVNVLKAYTDAAWARCTDTR